MNREHLNTKRIPATTGKRRSLLRLTGVCLATTIGMTLLTTSETARAQDAYPAKPIKIVLGSSAGGGTDAIARTLARHMADTLSANVIVDNKPGANGNIAAESVARAPADGYTLLYNTSSIASSPALYGKRLTYNLAADFVPVARTASLPIVLIVPAKSPFATVQDLIAHAKKHPGELNYASAGNGNVTHLASLSFEDAVGVKGMHIPYKGEAPAIVDVMAGLVDYYFATSPGAIPAVQSGRARALAVASIQPLETLPGVPTLHDTVAKNLDLSAWSGIMAPAGTPADVIAKLNAAVNKALVDPAVLASFSSQSAQVTPSSANEYGSFLAKEVDSLSKVIKDAGLSLD